MSDTATVDLASAVDPAERRLADLEAELAGHAAAAAAAEAAGDAAQWLRLRARSADLPGLIDEAHLVLLRLRLCRQWEIVEELAAVERARAADLAAVTAKVASLRSRPAQRDRQGIAIDVGAAIAAGERVRVVVAAELAPAAAAARDAKAATTLALAEIDDLEAAIAACTGHHPASDARGTRVRPAQLTDSVMLTAADVPDALHDRLDQNRRLLLVAGARAPRWFAHLLDPAAAANAA